MVRNKEKRKKKKEFPVHGRQLRDPVTARGRPSSTAAVRASGWDEVRDPSQSADY